MEISDIAAVFQSAVCIVLFAIVLLKFWSAARLDAFRQEMFIIRDELFDYAASGQIAFDNPSYRPHQVRPPDHLLSILHDGYRDTSHRKRFRAEVVNKLGEGAPKHP
ncbi:MAG: hypothetical protein PVS2B2_28790 [Candidatus Acidiferrum sp.]